jgi:hypothetical protein
MAESQNFRVAVRNYSGIDFIATEEQMDFGGVYEVSNIKAGTTTTTAFYTRGDRDAAAGTQGTLTYEDKDKTASITFKWCIPWGLGKDTLDVSVTGDIKLKDGKNSWRGDEVLRKNVEVSIQDDLPVVTSKRTSNVNNLFSFFRSLSKKKRRRK